MNQSTIASSNYNTTARYKLYLSNLSNGQSFSPNCPRQLVPRDTRIAKLITDIDCPLLSPVKENFIPRYLLICLHFIIFMLQILEVLSYMKIVGKYHCFLEVPENILFVKHVYYSARKPLGKNVSSRTHFLPCFTTQYPSVSKRNAVYIFSASIKIYILNN